MIKLLALFYFPCFCSPINRLVTTKSREPPQSQKKTHTHTLKIQNMAATLIQGLFTQFHSRKLLLHSPLLESPAMIPPSSAPTEPVDNSFDANVVMVLSVLLCALICSLGLNSIIRCALRCSSLISSDDRNSSSRLTNTGIKKKALKTFLTVSYTAELNLPGLHTECAICLSDFAQGEKVRVLPKCSHAFHVRCIDKWLNSHSSCPTCRHCLIDIDQKPKKVADCGRASVAPAQEESLVRIAPLEPEGLVRNHH